MPVLVSVDAAVAVKSSASGSEGKGFDPRAAADDLLAQLDDLLRNDASLDPGERDMLTEQFAIALRDVVAADDYAGTDPVSVLLDSVNQLKRIAAEADDGNNEIVRQLNDALAPLEQRKTKIAFEFSRRLQADGEESALAWFRTQHLSEETGSTASERPAAFGNGSVRPSREEVTQSRSRRLRGPPTRK